MCKNMEEVGIKFLRFIQGLVILDVGFKVAAL
jgi:hypothetical protein